MNDVNTERRGDSGHPPVEVEYYRYSRSHNRPYFGRVMWASQGLPLRHVVMQELVRLESARIGQKPLHILEIGSWAGGSAITWAEALKRHHGGNGRVICVDPWKPYFDLTERPNAPVYREMWKALHDDSIYELFLHNIAAAGHLDIVLPFRGPSTEVLPAFPRGYFDIVFVDGNHAYAAVSADLKLAAAHVKDGGLLCGDDLELQVQEIDQAYARTQTESDYIRDPRSGREYHPGVTLAVGECIGPVSSIVGCWAARRRGTGWEAVDVSGVVCADDRIPAHLTRQDPTRDPAFMAWRKHSLSLPQPSDVAIKSAVTLPAPGISVNRRRALLIQLDFPTWATARPWSYSGAYGIREGLTANGVECVTIPAIAQTPCSAPASSLYHAKRFLQGQRFDQVWIWLVHTALDTGTLEWISELAPVRIGVLMETLHYDEDDYRWAPHLRHRLPELEKQLPYLTHLLAPDERDAAALENRESTNVLWWPTIVPKRYILSPNAAPQFDKAVFHGVPYGPRRNWVSHPGLAGLMTFQQPADSPAEHHRMFDRLQQAAQQLFSSGRPVSESQLMDYAACLQQIREGEFTQWMAELPRWAAVVNLPSLAKFYGGRVFEGMASGRPVLSWSIPDHPKNRALFDEGREIILFPGDQPEALAEKLKQVFRDRPFVDAVARAGQRKVERYHTGEYRLQQTLRWIETGAEPDYGIGAGFYSPVGVAAPPAPSRAPDGPKTTVFVLTVDDPAFPACKAALDAQQDADFTVEIIRNVSPFSAAAQEMIRRCRTSYFIQIDEDMMMDRDAVAGMERVMDAAPDDIGMICFHLYDEDRELTIQGVKIYRTAMFKELSFQDVKASEMDLLDQMNARGIKWILHPDVKGRHGTHYTIESIYRRYKTMYEKDIRQWNVLTSDVRRKAERFRETGDPLQLFALLGAVHGIVHAPSADDREKDARLYALHELDVFKRLFMQQPPVTQAYDGVKSGKPVTNHPIPFDQVRWKTGRTPEAAVSPLSVPSVDESPPSAGRKRVLLVTPYFWPSVGGVERVAEELGVGLVAHGYHVDVATYPVDGRDRGGHRGLNIITVANHDQVAGDLRICILQVERLLQSGRYAACILLGAPSNALLYGALIDPFPADTVLLVQPTMNEETYDDLIKDDFVRPLFLTVARRAKAVLALSQQGPDARFLREHDIPAVYVPNGVPAVVPTGKFRETHSIPADAFVILHVANLYPVKNHPGLLRALIDLPAGAKLVMIGRPTEESVYVRAVEEALSTRPDVLYLRELSAGEVAAAMKEADLLVLASHSEASPLCILEAMSHRLAWLATPGCGAVHEQAGGIIAELDAFSAYIRMFMRMPVLRHALADLGVQHWQACYQWRDVLQGWIDVIERGALTRSFSMPDEIRGGMVTLVEQVRGAFMAENNKERTQKSPGALSATNGGTIQAKQGGHGTGEASGPIDQFYVNLFVNAPAWSAPYPNSDEAARWSKIGSFLEYILRDIQQKEPGRRLRILDVGCGRGWLTNLATMYGTCEGVEPVAGVVEHARKLFPHLRFEVGTAEVVSGRADFEPYDVILTSEVIEHVPHGQKEHFLAQLFRLLKPAGYVVLTTPRGEMWEQWKTIAPPNQPVEDWVTEEQLRTLFTSQGFWEMGLDRIHVEVPGLRYVPAPTPADLRSMNLLPIYQVWCCGKPGGQHPIRFTRLPKVSVIVPTYNRPDRLRTALASLAAQTYQDFEVIVVNDAGSDVEFVVAGSPDRHRITTICHDRNRGLAAARNSGIRAAKGAYIAYLDDDDRYLPNHLETLVGYLDRRECRVAYTDAWRVQERQSDGEYIEAGRDVPYSYDFRPADLLVSNYFPVLCVMHDKACLDDVGLFDESLFAHEDWDLWIRMATRFPFKHLAVTTAEFTWRTDGSSMTSGTRDTYRRTTEIIYRKYRPYADLIGGVHDAQDKRLAEMRSVEGAKNYVCSIVMPVWNRVELTKKCLTALAGLKDHPEYELIIVDNGSTDGTAEFLRQLSGDVRIIGNGENLGFAKACNQGAAAARGTYLVFLNNDTLPQPGWLTALVAEVDGHAEVGIVGSKLLYPDGTIQHAGVVRDRKRLLPYHIYKSFAGDHPAVNHRRELQIVTAACMLVRRTLFDELGGFDEAFRNGFEDADLCLRAQQRGQLIVYQPRSQVYHLESQTPGRKAHEEENAARFLERWESQWWAADEDRHFHADGFKLKRVFRNGLNGGDIQVFSDIKDRAAWAHVAATQAAALKQDWPAVKRELSLASDWPNDPEILGWASSLCERLQEPRLGQAFLSRYLALEEAPKERLSLIRSLLEHNDLQGADSHLQLLLASSPNHAEALLLKGVLCMQREQYEQAEIAFSSALQEGGERKKCLMGIGMAAMGRAYTQGAWERFLEVLAENPDDAKAIHWLLRAGSAQNRWSELAEHLHRYVARNPGDIAARFAFAGVLLRDERIEAARREYDALQTLAPGYDGLEQLGQAITGKEAAIAMETAPS